MISKYIYINMRNQQKCCWRSLYVFGAPNCREIGFTQTMGSAIWWTTKGDTKGNILKYNYPKDHWTLKSGVILRTKTPLRHTGSFTRNHWRVLPILRVVHVYVGVNGEILPFLPRSRQSHGDTRSDTSAIPFWYINAHKSILSSHGFPPVEFQLWMRKKRFMLSATHGLHWARIHDMNWQSWTQTIAI